MFTAAITLLVVGCVMWACWTFKTPCRKASGSGSDPCLTSSRVRLRDGRYLAYKERGAAKESARFKVIISHGFNSSKETYIPLSDDWLEKLGIYMLTFDRPGYAESDPNPNRSPKSDALDIQELTDKLELGPKFYLIGLSLGVYPIWGCLKYLPHRVAGVALVVPVINYWWPSLPSKLSTTAYRQLTSIERFRICIAHHLPVLAWLIRTWFPFPTVELLREKAPQTFNRNDWEIIKSLSTLPPSPDEHKVLQHGEYESLHRDTVICYGKWDFDPMNLTNPFPDNGGSAHMWIGHEDRFVYPDLQRYVAQKLPWIRRHEVPEGGHLFVHDPSLCEVIFKSLLLGEKTPYDIQDHV